MSSNKKVEKLKEYLNRCSCTNKNYKKILTRAFFVLAPAAKPWLIQAFFYWLHETTACCYFGVDLGNGLNHNSLSRLLVGTPYSSSDLPYFTLLLPLTWTNYYKSNSFSPFFFFDKIFPGLIPLFSSLRTKFSKSNFNFTKIF